MCNVCKYASLYGDAIHCGITHSEVFKRCDDFKLDEVLEVEMLKEEKEDLINCLRWVLKHDGYLSVKQVLSKYTDDIKLTEEEKKILGVK